MKVYEIITESRILNEQLNLLIRSLEVAIEKGSLSGIDAAVNNGLKWIAQQLAKKGAQGANELAEAWYQTARMTGRSLDDVIAQGEKEAVAAGIDRNVISTAKAQANKLLKSTQPGMFAKLKTNAQKAQLFYGGKMEMINGVLTAWGIGVPILECISNIASVYERSDAGEPELQGAKLQWAVQFYIDKCVQQVLAVWLGSKVAKFPFGPNGIQQLPFLGGPKMSAMFNAMSSASQATFLIWFQSEAGQEAFARWMVGEALLPGGKMFKGFADLVSGMAKTGYDQVLTKLGSDKAGKPDPNVKPTPSEYKPDQEVKRDIYGAPLN